MVIKQHHITDTNQNFWQLTCIQSAAQSLPGMLLGQQLAEKYGAGTALLSICAGNLILWLIGLTLISMTFKERSNAMENVVEYLGRISGILASLVLIFAFLNWYAIGTQSAIESMEFFLKPFERWIPYINLRIGAALGLFTALLAMGGIRLIKWTCFIAFPLLLIFIFHSIFASNYSPHFSGTWGFSLPAMIISAAITLPGFVNLPTFFRHGRSKEDVFLALSLITMFDILFEISSIFTGITNVNLFIQPNATTSFLLIYSVAFIILSVICLNLINVYFVSAGGQIIFPHLWQSKEYAIIGMLGVVIYIFFQIESTMLFLENMSANFISCLGIVLLLAFIVRLIVKHRPRPFEKLINSIIWLVGCTVSLIYQIHKPEAESHALLAGVGASILVFLIVIFIEEGIWSMKKLSLDKR